MSICAILTSTYLMLTNTYPNADEHVPNVEEHVPDMGGWLAIWTHVDAVA